MWYNASFTVVIAEFNMSLKNDRPALMVKIGDKATMECCWECQQGVNATWFARIYEGNWTTRAFERPVNATEDISIRSLERGECCGSVSFKSVKMSDTGMYRCRFSRGNQSITNSHGTYLHVYGKCLCVCYDVRWAMQISLMCQQGRMS